MSLSPVLQRRLETRRIACSNDPEFIKLVPWMRFTFVLCGTLLGVGTALAFTPLLWAMVPIAGLGGIFPRHPFDLVYNYGVRHLTGTVALPRNGAPTRFPTRRHLAEDIPADVAWLGYLLGGTLTAVATIVNVTHYCIPSMIYQLLFGRRTAQAAG